MFALEVLFHHLMPVGAVLPFFFFAVLDSVKTLE